MSTPTTVEIPTHRSSLRYYAILTAMLLALAAGVFGVYAMTRPDTGPAPQEEPADESRGAGFDCRANRTVTGGLIEGQTFDDGCGPVGPSLRGGVQP